MGLTIHYSFHLPGHDAAEARRVIEQLRQGALDLPFAAVRDIIDLSGPACDYSQCAHGAPNRWLLIQAGYSVQQDGFSYTVAPERLIAFTTSPGKGSEPASFGLCLYPDTIDADPRHDVKRVKTGLSSGWYWSSFCKTQYASNPADGDVENFLRAHLSIIRLLDHARDLGILHEVTDEGGYWDGRDVKALVEEVGRWNSMIAGFVGGMKDLMGGKDVQSQITSYPNYERLEAEGRKDEDATQDGA